jgi:hypothetical protein
MPLKSPRKGKPLLLATAGLASISFVVGCEAHAPVGNLRMPDPPQEQPVGNLRAPDHDMEVPSPDGEDAGTPGPGAGEQPPPGPDEQPVGNLRPPPSPREGSR